MALIIFDCILWFVERFILIKSSVDTCYGIHKLFFSALGPRSRTAKRRQCVGRLYQ